MKSGLMDAKVASKSDCISRMARRARPYLAYFDSRIVEIKHLLGPQIELERWTTSWGHLFESERLDRLDDRFAGMVARRLASQIAVLQPMVEEAAIPREPRDQSTQPRGPWRQRARRR